MKITKSKLREIIKEELSSVLKEGGPPPDARQVLEKFKFIPDLINDYYHMAQARDRSEFGHGLPDWFTPEFARRMLIQVASLVTQQEVSGLSRLSVNDLVDMIEGGLR